MKYQVSVAAMALIGYSGAAVIKPVRPLSYHWNEDPHSVPDPIRGATQMTSTQAKYLRQKQVEASKEQEAEPLRAYNDRAPVPGAKDEGRYFYHHLSGAPEDDTTVLWRVTPDNGQMLPINNQFVQTRNLEQDEDSINEDDALMMNGVHSSGFETGPDNGLGDEDILVQQRYDESEGPTKEDNGELDQVVVYRENDVKNGEKFSGWTNPLSWTDDGNADDTVLLQQNSKMRLRLRSKYDEAEGPTKEDSGELDQVVVYREDDIKNGEKFSGWTNPLSWTDDGNADDTVLFMLKSKLQYDEAEGPTKEDSGELDQVVVYREDDIKNGEKFSGWTNPLSWTDDGANDDTVM